MSQLKQVLEAHFDSVQPVTLEYKIKPDDGYAPSTPVRYGNA